MAPDKMMDCRNLGDIYIEIGEMLQKLKAPIKTECCIYKVPKQIRQLNEDAYTPKVVSIGPFHHQNPILQKMESQKQVCLNRFLERTKTDLGILVSLVGELEERVRRCYSENINFHQMDFVKMILLDAGFIIEFFYLCSERAWKRDDAFLWVTWLSDSIIKDLYLLENQLPFFVLNQLYNLAFANSPRDNFQTFCDLTFHVFSKYNKHQLVPDTICHFTDLLRRFHLQLPDRPLEDMGKASTDLNTVSELRDAGIKFRANKTSKCLLDLRLSRRILEIPQLTLDNETEMLFCNMIALEQCRYPLQQSITDYVCVLSCLIRTDEDANVLVKNRIIVNYLDSINNMTRLFHRLGKNAPLLSLNCEYYPLFGKLMELCENPNLMTRLVAALRRDFLQTLATLGGIVLLSLTVIQTGCSIVQVLQGNNKE